MDNITNRAVLIGVSLTITVAVVSVLMIVINQTREIYKLNEENSFLFTEGFSEFDMYNNTRVKGIDVMNCMKKYESDDRIVININTGATKISARCGEKTSILRQINELRSILEKEYVGESGYNIFYKATYDDTGKKEQNKVFIDFVKE